MPSPERAALVFSAFLALCGPAFAGQRSYRLPSVDLKQPIIWGSACEQPEGGGLAFGGHEQAAEDGRPHTRIREGDAWKPIAADLRAANPLQKLRDRVWAIRIRQRNLASRARYLYFEAKSDADLSPDQERIGRDLSALIADLEKLPGLGEYEAGQVQFALGFLRSSATVKQAAASVEAIKAMAAAQIELEKAAEALDAEPPARALSPIAYDPKSKVYVLFGGDHLDYLTNDTWVFDPAKRKWMQRHPKAAPPPRANHQLKATDGKVTLSGGYAYTSNTDYCGGQYIDLTDGDWVYDVAANTWTGTGAAAPPDTRVYRTGPFHPDFYLDGPPPDPAEFAARLNDLPANTWCVMKPPRLPSLNRDWGTATFDPDLDLILRWSGGHSAHGGSDVPHYHLATNRWELPFPVEFPLGQLYSNTSYPGGFNFNLRPWVTGHTYQNYAYDTVSKKLLFTGHEEHYYIYDPAVADWVGRAAKPKGMVYNSCFYTLTLCPTQGGVYCWTAQAGLFRFDPAASAWVEVKVEGKLPGASVDFSTIAYDSKRDRLLLVSTAYGKGYDGQVYAVDLKSLAVQALSPKNMAAVAPVRFGIDRGCYDPGSDLLLLATLLPPDADGFQRTPAYDCAGNRWVSLKLAYEIGGGRKEPQTPRGHSCGILFDPKRKLIWGVDTNSQVYVLRLDAAAAGLAEMQ